MSAPRAASAPSYDQVRRYQVVGGSCAALAALGLFLALGMGSSGNGSVVGVGLLGALVLGVAAAIFLIKAQGAEEAFWQDFAAANRWRCIALDTDDRPERFRSFRPFGQGGRRKARFVLLGTWQGMQFEAFTYQYTVSSGKSSHTYYSQVLAVPVPAQPDLSISPENVGHKILDALGGEDLDTESDEFSRLFWVRAEDRRRAYAMLNPGMMEHLLQVGPVGTWQWKGPWLLRVRHRKLRPEDVLPLLGEVRGFLENLPRDLVAKQAWAQETLSAPRRKGGR
jgi:hypothetical protein